MLKILLVSCVLSLQTGPHSLSVRNVNGRFVESDLSGDWTVDFCGKLDKSELKWNTCVKRINSNNCSITKSEVE